MEKNEKKIMDLYNNRKTYFLQSYGCQMNVRDSETIAGLLEAAGYHPSPRLDEAGLVVLNTCSVRHSAENKVFGKLGELNKLKKRNPNLLVALGGCMAQLPEIRGKLRKQGVDIVFGTHNIHELPLLVEEAIIGQQAVYRVWDREGAIVESLPVVRKPGLSGFVNIMYGCDNCCSYCIVPYTRGRERSRLPVDIMKEVHQLAEQGYVEITLLGQNVNSYGHGLEDRVDFADLLEQVNGVDGIKRIRFMTSHPKDMSVKLIAAIADLDKVCEHVHVPLQAGSNAVLKAMNRSYTREHYLELSQRLRSMIPEVTITTDLIVGFPGESETDFQETLDMVQKVRFDAAFTFMYSKRSGTKAAEMNELIGLDEKRSRLLRLNHIQYKIAADLNREFEGKIVEVMVEGPSKTNPETLSSRTRGNRIVILKGPQYLVGQTLQVKITEAKTFSMFGEIVK